MTEPATTVPPVDLSARARAASLVPFAPEQVLICGYGFVGKNPTGNARLVRSAGLLEPLVTKLVEATNRLPQRRGGAERDGNDCAAPARSGFLDFESGTQVIDLRYVSGCHAAVTNGLRNASATPQWLRNLHRLTLGT